MFASHTSGLGDVRTGTLSTDYNTGTTTRTKEKGIIYLIKVL